MCVEGTRDMATAFTTRCPDVTVVVYIIFVQNTKWRETDHNIAFDFLSAYYLKTVSKKMSIM